MVSVFYTCMDIISNKTPMCLVVRFNTLFFFSLQTHQRSSSHTDLTWFHERLVQAYSIHVLKLCFIARCTYKKNDYHTMNIMILCTTSRLDLDSMLAKGSNKYLLARC
jgi:hypothetical protein